ncbi:MAG: F0F1 ATP synthase subunit gamma, partial [Terriglobales bacterium]
MANVLDIRRRIRSVVNTRQITKAMKTVSAAKLRRAQEAALAARPYSQMLTNVLKSLISRADIYDPITGEPRHPLLAERPEKNIALIVVTGDKGLAGAFNTNILKMASKFIQSKPDENIDLECIGRKGRDFMRRRFPMAQQRPEEATGNEGEAGASPVHSDADAAARAGRVQITGEYVGVLGKVDHNFANTLSQGLIARYCRGEIDAVYILFNEFKSVIAQRLVAERLLPIKEIGEVDVQMAEEASEEERKKRIEAAKTAHVGLRPMDTSAVDEAAAHFATLPVDYIYEQPPEQLFEGILPKYVGIQIFHALLE